MKITLHENGWVVIVQDLDFGKITKEQVDILGCLVSMNTLVISKNNKVTEDDEARISEMFGNPFIIQEAGAYLRQKNYKQIARVTGEKNEDGIPGAFSMKEVLDWHCNYAERKDRESIVWLYSERGSKGSVTSFSNHIRMYNDLSSELQGYLQRVNMVIESTNIDESNQAAYNFDSSGEVLADYQPSLVYTNQTGTTGLFFPYGAIKNFVGMSDEHSNLFKFLLRDHLFSHYDKYIYDHHWEDGDIVISDQWLGLHCRQPFEHIEQRLLHRIAFQYTNIDFSQAAALREALKTGEIII